MAIEQNKMGLELYKVLAAKEYGYNLTMYDTAGAGTTTPLKAKYTSGSKRVNTMKLLKS